MSTNYEDLEINQGSDFSVELHLVKPDGSKKNLNGHSIISMMKLGYDADSDNTVSFNTSILDSDNGVVQLSLTNSQTDNLNPKGKYLYDVELLDSFNSVERILEGRVLISPSVTK